jgi:hypothetical protein
MHVSTPLPFPRTLGCKTWPFSCTHSSCCCICCCCCCRCRFCCNSLSLKNHVCSGFCPRSCHKKWSNLFRFSKKHLQIFKIILSFLKYFKTHCFVSKNDHYLRWKSNSKDDLRCKLQNKHWSRVNPIKLVLIAFSLYRYDVSNIWKNYT